MLGNGIGGLPGRVDDVVEFQVQVTAVATHDIPVCLLALQVQLDQIEGHLLKGAGLSVLRSGGAPGAASTAAGAPSVHPVWEVPPCQGIRWDGRRAFRSPLRM